MDEMTVVGKIIAGTVTFLLITFGVRGGMNMLVKRYPTKKKVSAKELDSVSKKKFTVGDSTMLIFIVVAISAIAFGSIVFGRLFANLQRMYILVFHPDGLFFSNISAAISFFGFFLLFFAVWLWIGNRFKWNTLTERLIGMPLYKWAPHIFPRHAKNFKNINETLLRKGEYKFFIGGAIIFFVLALDCYDYLTPTQYVSNGLLSIGEHVEMLSDIERVEKNDNPDKDVSGELAEYKFYFKDGQSVHSGDFMFPDRKSVVEFLMQKTSLRP